MSLAALERELDRWRQGGRTVTLWWRDDDAASATAKLSNMLALVKRHAVPLALAVVPARLEVDLVEALAGVPEVTVLQHGYAHRNHAPAGARSAELGVHRPASTAAFELAQGRDRLRAAFGPRFLPVLVPPWNRIAPDVVAELAGLGMQGLSTFGPRSAATTASGQIQCNAHVDPIAWRQGRTFVGADAAAARLTVHLIARREASVDPAEPTGLLTHHLDFDQAAWAFVEHLLDVTAARPGVAWLSAAALFANPISARSA